MRNTRRSIRAMVAVTGLSALVTATLTVPAQAMPERFHDAGTIVWCEGEGSYLEAFDTTQVGTGWKAELFLGGSSAVAGSGEALLVGNRLEGSATAVDSESFDEIGELSVEGTVVWGATEVLSGWDVDEDGRRTRTEGTRTPLSGTATLSLGAVETTLSCTGWEIDLTTFRLNREPAAWRGQGWYSDGYVLGDGEAFVSFYGDRKTKLGIALDLVDQDGMPDAFAGERLQVRNGKVEGTLILHDPETWEIVGAASVEGTIRRTGSERVIEKSKRPSYRFVYDRVFYDVSLTITSAAGTWSGTFEAIHETVRSRVTIPPRSLRRA
ncbi:hypothetical protein [Intrasporangium calvum]|uniref:hypothetical protein n=1 Tax=Intrasporangium calvum TaxID=53358 RepID=UPI000DF6088C|nr:hypothetical protein [Intrasporangium calvum]AXG12786.1 hypothetical protein DN585_04565 [Intrasporangium calvum]